MGTAYQNMFRVGIIDKDFIKKDELKIIICTFKHKTGPHFIPQPVQPPETERLAKAPRWSWENNTETAIARMEIEKYAYLNTLQSIYSQLGKARASWDFFSLSK